MVCHSLSTTSTTRNGAASVGAANVSTGETYKVVPYRDHDLAGLLDAVALSDRTTDQTVLFASSSMVLHSSMPTTLFIGTSRVLTCCSTTRVVSRWPTVGSLDLGTMHETR